MKKRKLALIFGFISLLFFSTFNLQPSTCVCYAQLVSGTELINNAFKYDKQKVSYSGEVIGDVMLRGQSCWVNVYDGSVAVGIWMDAEAADKVLYTGSYKAKGDIIEVEGIFNRACKEHGGDLDIHAEVFKVVALGMKASGQPDPVKKNTAVIFLGILCIIWILNLLKRR